MFVHLSFVFLCLFSFQEVPVACIEDFQNYLLSLLLSQHIQLDKFIVVSLLPIPHCISTLTQNLVNYQSLQAFDLASVLSVLSLLIVFAFQQASIHTIPLTYLSNTILPQIFI